MADIAKRITRHWQDDVNLVLGVWLFLSPWILQYGAETAAAAQWNAHVLGIVVALVAVAAIAAYHKAEEWVAVLLGAWLIASPWILGYGAFMTAVWNQVIVGAAVLILALWSALTTREVHQAA